MSIIIYRLITFFDSSSGCKRACAVAVLLSNIIATIEIFIFQVLLIVFLMLIYFLCVVNICSSRIERSSLLFEVEVAYCMHFFLSAIS